MDQRTTLGNLTSRPTWEGLHEWLRNAIQTLIQEALEAEVTELPGRVRSPRRAAVDAPAGDRNGDGQPRTLTPPHPLAPQGAGPRGAGREPDPPPVRPAHEGGLGTGWPRGTSPWPGGGAAFRPHGGPPEGAVAGGGGGLAKAATG